jgi:hypothetical protein
MKKLRLAIMVFVAFKILVVATIKAGDGPWGVVMKP